MRQSNPDEIIERYFEASGLFHTEEERRSQKEAYRRIVERAETAPDAPTRQVIERVLDYALRGAVMRLTYVEEQVIDDALKEHRKAKREIIPIGLFTALERIFARASSTSSFGRVDRYPLHGNGSNMHGRQIRSPRDALPEELLASHYSFGAHTFHVGQTIQDIVELLETRYGLDFAKLEKARGASQKRD
jgi:hypothetical protein